MDRGRSRYIQSQDLEGHQPKPPLPEPQSVKSGMGANSEDDKWAQMTFSNQAGSAPDSQHYRPWIGIPILTASSSLLFIRTVAAKPNILTAFTHGIVLLLYWVVTLSLCARAKHYPTQAFGSCCVGLLFPVSSFFSAFLLAVLFGGI
ncbi:hypothetical protein F5883DRAFT_142231 [Diaporthe sp. PMI_573]|nr:hypothetical protein F5883DRAFT_142231 [Diaporthaceae sp. PMI_573]